MLEVHESAPELLDRLVRIYEAAGGAVAHREPEHAVALLRFPACACCRQGQVIPSIERQGYLYLPPSTYSSEGERYQFLVPEDRLDGRLREHLPAADEVVRLGVESLASAGFEGEFLVPVGSLLDRLSPRQREAMLLAVLRGYYRIPRAITTGDLATLLRISRPAYDALLRKAENKLIGAFFPYLASHASGGTGALAAEGASAAGVDRPRASRVGRRAPGALPLRRS